MLKLPLHHEFLTSVLVEKSGSKHTQSSYARDLHLFEEFLQATSPTLKEVTRFSQIKLQSFCERRKLSRRSQARMVSTLRSYFKFLLRRGLIKELPKLEMIKHTRALPETLSDSEIQALLKACQEGEKNEYRALRNRTVLMILYSTGCRVSELCDISIKDVHLDTRIMRISGKGSKERLVPLVTRVTEVLQEYLSIRQHLAEVTERALIVNDRGNRPSRIDIFRWLKRWSSGAGFSKTSLPINCVMLAPPNS